MPRFPAIKCLDEPLTRAEVAAGAVAAAPFIFLLFGLYLFAPVSPEQLLHADPLVAALDAWIGRPFVPAAATTVVCLWGLKNHPVAEDFRAAGKWAALGALAALLVVLLIRFVVGDSLPAFIPPEESSRPGLRQGLAAGVIEEVLFRLMALPALYFGLRRRTGEVAAKIVAVIVTGILFALSHETGPLAGEFIPRLFVTRTLFPGIFMSALFFVAAPAFIIAAHCSAHLLIPFLFV